jgi:hypothetical protein
MGGWPIAPSRPGKAPVGLDDEVVAVDAAAGVWAD